MTDIDRASIKQILWQKMRDDLCSYVPWFRDNNRLLCPVCCRPLTFDEFSLEHIIPQQALAGDPDKVVCEITRNERSGLTLLCRTPLYIKGEKAHPNGCNGWKGRYYDGFIRRSIRDGFTEDFNQRHHIGLACAGYLALVRKFGYQIVLLPSGRLMRSQFFSPNKWRDDMPERAQIALAGDVIRDFDESLRSYWSEPFKFAMHDGFMIVIVRSMSLLLPISRDPTIPFAFTLPYAPPRFKLKPDLYCAFDS